MNNEAETNMTDKGEGEVDITDKTESVELNLEEDLCGKCQALDCNSNDKTVNYNSFTKENENGNYIKLSFGIERLLKEESSCENIETGKSKYTRDDKDDIPINVLNLKDDDRSITEELNEFDNYSDDEDRDINAFRLKSAAFQAESARARLALLRYSSTFSVYNGVNGVNGVNGGHCLQTNGTQQNMFQPSFTVPNADSGYNSWPTIAASSTEPRKDRFGFVRRVGHPYQNRTPPKRKKPRTSFTRLQILELEKRFERQKYLASTERSALAKTLKMTDAQVKTWFQNRRTKWRRQTAEEREIERQAANRLLLSLHSEPTHRKSVVIPTDPVCLSHFQRWQDQRSADV